MNNRDLIAFAIFVFYRLVLMAYAIFCVTREDLYLMAVLCVFLAFMSSFNHKGGKDV